MRATIVLVGGGLANCLIAYRLVTRRPDLDLVLLERDERLAGRHTWSFHADDLTPEQHAWIAPLVAHSWTQHEVRFPPFTRRLQRGYFSLTSERVREVVGAELGRRVRLRAEVAEVSPHEVRLRDGSRVAAEAIVDGRGDPGGGHLELGYQKFLGQSVVLDEDHGLSGPILMDATVAQVDGFRFVYTLTLSRRRLLIEDTRYSDHPELARDEMGHEIEGYARARGWRVRHVEGEEEGVLPIVLGGDIEAFWNASGPGVPRSGMRAALFHPTTGYSLPEAVRLAEAIGEGGALRSPALYELTRGRSREVWRRGGFFRALNRMLFRAAAPERRYRVLEHFYRLPEPLIGRFYAGRVTWWDKVQVLSGRPPVPVGRALKALLTPRSRSRAFGSRAGGEDLR